MTKNEAEIQFIRILKFLESGTDLRYSGIVGTREQQND